MRLPVVAIACGLVATLAPPLRAEPSLPARTFDITPTALPVVPVPGTWEAPVTRVRVPRVRPTDQRIAAVLRIGLERSPRLRALMELVEIGNVVAHVSMDPKMDGGLSGRLTFVSAAGDYRYVRVMINPDQTGEQIIAALAHELQHVREVGEHPEVTTEVGLSELYKRIGHSNRAGGVLGWETAAAQDITYEVRRELNLGPTAVARRTPTPATGGRAQRF
jgi:hypothetical protein